MSKSPKLRTVSKSLPPFPINDFPHDFPYKLGRELVYLLATKGRPSLEGSEFEAIFAACIGAEWKPSNVGLDDIILKNTAWGAKTVKNSKPASAKRVRLISGRNSIDYSFDETLDRKANPNIAGSFVLDIWNDRVSAVREKFDNLRTVVLVKSDDLTEVVIFEFETIRYDPELFTWRWNKGKNLEGIEKSTSEHRFTWQPHGSQFTIIEEVPESSLIIRIKNPDLLDKDEVLSAVGFDRSWVTVVKHGEK